MLSVQEDGWVVCRVFKKKCFFKIGGGEGSTSQGADAGGHLAVSPPLGGHHDQARAALAYMHPHPYYHHASSYYSQMQAPGPHAAAYSHHVQVQDLLTNHRPTDDGAGTGYDFSGLPVEHHPGSGLDLGSSDGVATDGGQLAGEGRDQTTGTAAEQWQAMDGFSNGGSAMVQQMTGAMSSGAQRGGEMDLWGYGR